MADVYIMNLSGFMLGNPWHAPRNGEPWLARDTMVYVCRNIDVAKRILESSQHGFTDELNPVWTTIYHVTSPMIKCVHSDRAMLWTTDATKIIVDAPVFHRAPKPISEEALINNARIIGPGYFKLAQKVSGGKVK